MADKINKNLEEGYTEFGSSTGATTGYYIPTGPLGRFFAKFFATPAQAELAKEAEKGVTPLTGDTVISTQTIKRPEKDIPAVGSVVRNPVLPQLEMNRKKRYKEYKEIGRATSELQSHHDLVCRLLLEKKKKLQSHLDIFFLLLLFPPTLLNKLSTHLVLLSELNKCQEQ